MNWAQPALDHLVVYAASLDEGAAWCECTLGLPPGLTAATGMAGGDASGPDPRGGT